MSDNKGNIDDLIRDGFQSSDDGFDVDSWSDVEQMLDSTAGIDQQIIQAFNQIPEELPSSAWPEIKEDLDINTVWNRIRKQLQRKKRRAFIWWNAAAIGLLLILAGYVFQDEIKSSITVSNEVKKQINVKENLNPETSKIESSVDFDEVESAKNDVNVITAENGNVALHSTAQYTIIHTVSNEISTNQSQNVLKDNITINSERTTIEPLSTTSIDLIELPVFDTNFPETEINPLDSNKPLHARRWIVGVFGAIDNSILSDATTRDAFTEHSLNSNNFTTSLNYGLLSQFFTKNNYFIQTEFYWNSRIKRSTQEYQHFQYVRHLLELDYYQLSVSFGKSIPVRKNKQIWFNPSIGLYGSYLKQSREYQQDILISNNTSYKKWNYGLQANLGVQHEFNRFVVGYGLHSIIGLENIFKGTEKQSSLLNVTRTFSNGFYLRVGFKL
ncbi:MAG: hypothetical protein HUJ25_06715 [Crocinitomicaceae bacterium]|nr:hypothetical protein [Crocinitomicaceae bacterium]